MKANKTLIAASCALWVSAALLAPASPAHAVTPVATIPAWAPDTYYAAGAVVSYNGRLYRALVSQTDYSGTGWNPTVASLWTDIGPASGAPAPAPAPSPSPVPAPSPSPAPTPAPSGNCAPAWSSSKAYTSGEQASTNSTNYRANWWTQGNNPATSSGPAGSGQPWTALGSCSGTPAPVPSPSPAPSPSPTPAPTPTPAPSPSPAPSPAPTPAPNPTNLPKHALVGYWHNFTNPSGATFPIRQVSNDFDVVVVAFADDAGNGAVSFTPDPNAGSETQFIADVAELKRRGKKVVLSFGGQNGTVTLNNATNVSNFVNSTYALMQRFGFDGIDIDLESGAGVNQGAPVQTNLVTAVRQLRAKVGPSFYLSMAPEHPYVQGGYVSYGSIWGAYLPIIDGLRDELTVIHVQYYNNGAVYTPYSANGLAEGTVDALVGASLMLIEGFTTNYGVGPYAFRGLRPDQVAFGVPSGRQSANGGFVTSAVVSDALNCLTRLLNCGAIKPQQTYPTYRGVMTWSINWDRFDNFNFSQPARRALNSLP